MQDTETNPTLPRPSLTSRHRLKPIAVIVFTLLLAAGGCGRSTEGTPDAPRVSAPILAVADTEPSVDRGRYIIRAAGCNDCHTPGFMEKGFAVPESQWLTGVPLGWKGPWGTTYASNLRLFTKDMNEDLFLQVVRARNSRPPMPWPNLHAMTETDLRSLFRYIRSLPVTGDPMPTFVPPGQEPLTPYIEMVPRAPLPGPTANTTLSTPPQAAGAADPGSRSPSR